MTSTAGERVLVKYVCPRTPDPGHVVARAVATDQGVRLDVPRTPSLIKTNRGRPATKGGKGAPDLANVPDVPNQQPVPLFLSDLDREPFGPLVMACACDLEFLLTPQEIREHVRTGIRCVVLDPTE